MNLKGKISNIINKISKKLDPIPEKWKKVMFFGFLILAQTLVFPAGALAPQTKVEEAAQYMSELSVNETTGGNYSYILVEPKSDDIFFPAAINTEYYFWDTVFRDSKNSFVAAVNGNKENDIHFESILENKPLTFVYANVFSNKENGNLFRHEFYNFDLMFKGMHGAGGNYSFCYLTKTQADELILSKGKIPSDEEYLNLIGSSVPIIMGDNVYQWAIANIVLETSDLFFACREIFGEFLIGYTKYPDGFKKQYCLTFNGYDFQNRYKINYLKKNYDSELFSFSLGKNNLKDSGAFDNATVLDILESKTKSIDLFSVSVFLLSILFYSISFLLFLTFKYTSNLRIILFCLGTQLAIYLLFNVPFLIFKSVSPFSSISLIFFTIYLFLFLLAIMLLNIKRFLKPFGYTTNHVRKNKNINQQI